MLVLLQFRFLACGLCLIVISRILVLNAALLLSAMRILVLLRAVEVKCMLAAKWTLCP